ncbi:MAG: 3-phosphoshikimate 1-carboxyvinyltransferase [Prevotella sp.]|nr:3-phosphoshikimate 1-carboxyvinyltransferase [Prevotella sp.]
MYYDITAPSCLSQAIKLPASKSISNRALIIHALAEAGIQPLSTGSREAALPRNLSDCDDTEVIVHALRHRPHDIDIKAAGTAMRFMTAYLATCDGEEHLLTGTERMRHRPIHVLVDALRRLGASITYAGEEGFPPLLINGTTMVGGELDVPGNISSQFISALLLIGPVLRDGLTLRLTGNIISRPYIDLTLWTMREFGADAEWSDYDTIRVNHTPYRSRPYLIENDWSAASYWYEMMALSAGGNLDEIRLEGLMDGSKQGDSSLRYIFSLLGVKTTFADKVAGGPTTVALHHSDRCVPRLEYDFTNAPDLTQTFVVCCALLDIPFHFNGLSTLRIKETDRIEALKTEMRKLGYVIHDANGSELTWDGERCEPCLEAGIDTYEDHRMALSFAPAALRFPGLRINNPQVVSKSYPHFWDDLRQCGFHIAEESE